MLDALARDVADLQRGQGVRHLPLDHPGEFGHLLRRGRRLPVERGDGVGVGRQTVWNLRQHTAAFALQILSHRERPLQFFVEVGQFPVDQAELVEAVFDPLDHLFGEGLERARIGNGPGGGDLHVEDEDPQILQRQPHLFDVAAQGAAKDRQARQPFVAAGLHRGQDVESLGDLGQVRGGGAHRSVVDGRTELVERFNLPGDHLDRVFEQASGKAEAFLDPRPRGFQGVEYDQTVQGERYALSIIGSAAAWAVESKKNDNCRLGGDHF